MKINLFIITAFLFFIQTQNLGAQKASYDNYEVQVDGLGCPFCAYGLEKKFKEFKGIKKVRIEIETGVMRFDYPSDKPLSLTQVSNQVEKAGYTPIELNITRSNGKKEYLKPSETYAQVKGKTVNRSFFVNGKCDMCKARIEKTAKGIAGVASANWDLKTKQLTVSYSPSQTSPEKIMQAIASKGHDTQNVRATDAAYKSLPACCNYKRK